MRVQRVVMPVTETESWTLLDDVGVPVAPVENYLAYLPGSWPGAGTGRECDRVGVGFGSPEGLDGEPSPVRGVRLL